MRFAVYIRSVRSARGAEKMSVNVARGLAARGHQIDFLIEENKGALLERLREFPDRITIINLRDHMRPWLTRRLTQLQVLWCVLSCCLADERSLQFFRDVGSIALGDDPPLCALRDYVQSSHPVAVLSLLQYPNFVALMTALLCRAQTRFVVSVRNHLSEASRTARSSWQRRVLRLTRLLFPIADDVIGISQGVVEDVIRITGLPGKRVHVIYNPVYEPAIRIWASEPISHPWLAPGGAPVVLGVGKLKPQKDFATLISAFAKVREKMPAKLIILGEGDERPKLEEHARDLGVIDDVDLHGFVANPYPFYRLASVLVMSSIWEGFGNVLVEAMACGCPIVSTDCPSGPGEILSSGRFGLLVPVGNAEAIAAATVATLCSPPAKEALVRRAEDFSLDKAVASYEEILAST